MGEEGRKSEGGRGVGGRRGKKREGKGTGGVEAQEGEQSTSSSCLLFICRCELVLVGSVHAQCVVI